MLNHPKRFGLVLRDILIDQELTTQLGNPKWSELARRLPTMHYETLRKAVSGEREPSPQLMEECAHALTLAPEAFFEYRVWRARRGLDVEQVGLEAVLRALKAFESAATPQDTREG